MNRILFYIAFIVLLTSSCQEQNKQRLLPHVTGGMNDVLLIMSPGNWESEPGKVMQEALGQEVSSIPGEEYIFDIVWMPHEAFTRVVKKQRNIIITKIGPDYTAKISYHNSLWAESQIVIQIAAKSPEEFIALFNKNETQIIESLQNAELERLMVDYKKSQENTIRKKLVDKHNIDLIVPKGYTINLEENNFIWLDNRHRNIIEGILVYYYPYTDSSTFTKDFLIQKRDSILKKYVSGEKEGSYSATELRFPIETHEYKLNGEKYTFELRGLWNVVGGFAMGGPFISITQYDKDRGRIVTVDGFLFAPNEDKRNLIKRLEAILYSLNFQENKSE